MYTDMHDAIVKAISNGTTITDFRKDFDNIVAQHGWSYNGKRGWRTKVIFNTNMRTARMAAKWQTIQDNKDVAPYLEYDAVNDSRTRPQHKTWDGIILPVDDAFWDTHYPPNGWGCRCSVRQVSGATLKREGKSVSDAPMITRRNVGETHPNVPVGIDAGWDNNVGQAWIAPDVALGKKLATLPPNLAAYVYEYMVTEPFMRAVSKSFKKHFDAISRKENRELFFGYIRHDVNHALTKNADEIIERTAAFNAKQTDGHKITMPTHASLAIKNLAVLVPDFKQEHLLGVHRTKFKIKKRGGSTKLNNSYK